MAIMKWLLLITIAVLTILIAGSRHCNGVACVGFADKAWAAIPANLTKLRPIKGVSYQPSPSDDNQQQNLGGFNNVYFDSDFDNTDFAALWGKDGTGTGRQDLATIAAAGINFLHIYNWNPERDHGAFLDASNANGLKLDVPISNFTACLIIGNGCQGVSAASYKTAYDNIKKIFDNIYKGGTSPHPAAAIWDIFNEYDLETNIDPQLVVFAIQAILKLEADAGVPVPNQLPFMVPVSNAVRNQADYKAANHTQPAYFQQAETVYLGLNPGKTDKDIPPGIIATVALSTALQTTSTGNKTSYQAANDSGPVTVAPIPANFWTTRFIAAVNPFTTGRTVNKYVTDAGQFQSAFPGTTVWNSLPPLFFSEMGINRPPGMTAQGQADFISRQLKCTNPWAVDATSTPQGYFLGSVIFEYSYEARNGNWGMFFFTNPLNFTNHTTGGGGTYRVDSLNEQPAWKAVTDGYKETALTCPPEP